MMRRDPVLANRVPAPDYVDAVIGMIDELTKEIPVLEPKRRATAFSAIFGHAEVKQERDENGFDLLDLEMTAYSDFTLPDSFRGMSGGALWRIYFVEKDNSASIVERGLIGVPFYESTEKDSPNIITCHGPKGIYRSLIDEIMKKWPDAGAQA